MFSEMRPKQNNQPKTPDPIEDTNDLTLEEVPRQNKEFWLEKVSDLKPEDQIKILFEEYKPIHDDLQNIAFGKKEGTDEQISDLQGEIDALTDAVADLNLQKEFADYVEKKALDRTPEEDAFSSEDVGHAVSTSKRLKQYKPSVRNNIQKSDEKMADIQRRKKDLDERSKQAS